MLPKRIIAVAACLFVSLCTGTVAKAEDPPLSVRFGVRCGNRPGSAAQAHYGSPAVSNIILSAADRAYAEVSLTGFSSAFASFTAQVNQTGSEKIFADVEIIAIFRDQGSLFYERKKIPLKKSGSATYTLEITPNQQIPDPVKPQIESLTIALNDYSGSVNLVLPSLKFNNQPVSLLTNAPEARCP